MKVPAESKDTSCPGLGFTGRCEPPVGTENLSLVRATIALNLSLQLPSVLVLMCVYLIFFRDCLVVFPGWSRVKGTGHPPN